MTVRTAAKYTEVDVIEVDRFITNPQWVMEQKMDGTRGLAVISGGRVWFPGAGGRGSLAHTAATQHLPRINPGLAALMSVDDSGELVVDGEIMLSTGEFRLFDMPYLRAGGVELVRPSDPWHLRRRALEAAGATLAGFYAINPEVDPLVTVVRTAWTAHEKAAMWQRVVETGVEGAMVKRIDAPYLPDERTKDVLKLKLVKTADVVVYGSTRGRNAAGRETGGFQFGVAVSDLEVAAGMKVQAVLDGVPISPLGNCSAIGKPEVNVGDVIEVAYLYRPDGGALVQPRMIRVRHDKERADCRFDQFPAYSREAI